MHQITIKGFKTEQQAQAFMDEFQTPGLTWEISYWETLCESCHGNRYDGDRLCQVCAGEGTLQALGITGDQSGSLR